MKNRMNNSKTLSTIALKYDIFLNLLVIPIVFFLNEKIQNSTQKIVLIAVLQIIMLLVNFYLFKKSRLEGRDKLLYGTRIVVSILVSIIISAFLIFL